MGKPTGFLEYERETARVKAPLERIQDFQEFRTPLPLEKQRLQGARCMACGVPFCQSGAVLSGMVSGCPLHNLVPETNDLVYTGNWKQAPEIHPQLSGVHLPGLPGALRSGVYLQPERGACIDKRK